MHRGHLVATRVYFCHVHVIRDNCIRSLGCIDVSRTINLVEKSKSTSLLFQTARTTYKMLPLIE